MKRRLEACVMLTLWTVGHSTRPLRDFLDLLASHRIEVVADVRRFPGSRSQPQYRQGTLAPALESGGTAYLPLPGLGGRRRPASNGTATAWRHPSFRGYAEHVASEEFAGALCELLMAAWGLRTAVMCAEILWWRCHRRIIADVMVSLGARVIHVLDGSTAEEHRVRAPARIVRGVLTYAAS